MLQIPILNCCGPCMMTFSSDFINMLRIVVALVVWLYFMRIINYYALKVE